MKKTLTIALIFISFNCLCQKTKSKSIFRIQFASIDRLIIFNEDNIAYDTIYTLYGRDSRYATLVELIVIKRGTLYEIYSLLKKSKDFLKHEEQGTSDNINGVRLSVGLTMGVKYLTFWEASENGNGYTDLNGVQIKKLETGILEYCSTNNLKIIKPKE